MDLDFRTRNACAQLTRYGGVYSEPLANLLDAISDLNDDLHHMRDYTVVTQALFRVKLLSQAMTPDTLGAFTTPPKEGAMADMRAKFIVNGVQEHFSDEAKTIKTGETLAMSPVCKSGPYPEDGTDEDNTFARWSPSGSLTLFVANPNLWGKYPVGTKHYLDFTQAGV